MNDLLYIGDQAEYDELMEKLKFQFEDISIIDASDDIHEYRFSIELPDDQRGAYYKFIIKEGFGEASFTLVLLLQDPKSKVTWKSLMLLLM